ncbi:MAG TPA: hypothetical protein VJ952_00050, partial [Opitutales bacterium]|nr:hypothetical protein [Opitutales bacterium]
TQEISFRYQTYYLIYGKFRVACLTMKQPRNVSLRLDPKQKAELKSLANASGMTLSAYLETILNEAVQERPVYRPQRVKKETPHETAVAR